MYAIIELQQTGDGAITHTYFTADTYDKAMSKYHEVLMYAAQSKVEYHSCLVLDKKGNQIARECYVHAVEEQKAFL